MFGFDPFLLPQVATVFDWDEKMWVCKWSVMGQPAECQQCAENFNILISWDPVSVNYKYNEC